MRIGLWLTFVMLGALALPLAQAAPVALEDALDCGSDAVRADGDLTCTLDLSDYQDLSRLRVELVEKQKSALFPIQKSQTKYLRAPVNKGVQRSPKETNFTFWKT